MLLTLSFLQDPLNPIAAGDEAGNDHMLERIDAPGGSRDLSSQATEPYLAGSNLQHKIDSGFEPFGDVVNTGSRRSKAVAAGQEGPSDRPVLDAGDTDTHDRANVCLDLNVTRGGECGRSYCLGTVSRSGPIERHPSRGPGFLESIAAGQYFPGGGSELSHELFPLVLEEVPTMFGKGDLGPTGQQLSASRATLIHGESPRPCFQYEG